MAVIPIVIKALGKNRELDLAVPVDYRVKIKESEMGDKYLDFAGELKETVEHASDGDANCS